MKKIFLLSLIAGSMATLPLSAQTTKTATLQITATTKYQHIDGFGGTGMNGQWGDVYTQQKVNMLWGQGENQIGLNIMRIRINPNESNWGEYGNPVKWARAINPNVQVFATPWTPPKKYKTSKTTKYQNDFNITVWPLVEHSWGGEGSNGGAINPDCIEDFASFLERYRATMEKKGCPIDMISIQNECNYTPTATDNGVEHASYESCIYSPKEMAAMVKAARAKVNAKCKIMGPETFGYGQSGYNTTLLGMQDAVDNIDVWGNHVYGSMKTNPWGANDYDYINTVTKKTGKSMWMTEFLIDYNKDSSKGAIYNGEMSAEKDMIESIEYCLSHGYNAYVYYNMLDDFFACNHGGSATELWKRAYIFGHYAKYATGKTRVKSVLKDTNSALVGGSSYINEAGDTITCFVFNPSSNAYTLTLSIPFVPTNIKQIATGDAVNRVVRDITDKVNCTTKFPKVTLQPGIFYTFQFVNSPNAEEEEEPAGLAVSPKQDSHANPITPMQYLADPTGVEYNGRVYIYATNDQQEFDAVDGLIANTYGKIKQLVCLSSADMVNWTNHGAIDVKSISPWIYTSWAPSVISRQEADGKTHFYMYYTNSASGIGVLTATNPLGPWKDPLGKALIDGSTPGLGTIGNIIDPGAAINPETGEAYLTFGGGDVKGTNTALHPGNARIVKLGDNLISLGSEIKKIDAPCHFEANELNYIGGKWVYSYCTRWTISDWSQYSKLSAPSACSIVYMINSGDPLTDDWTYKGVMLPNPGNLGYPYGNNHSHLQKFGTGVLSYYLFYHSLWLERQNGFSGGYRNLHVNRTSVNESTAKITQMSSSLASLKGAGQLTTAQINPYDEQDGAMLANGTKDWWMVRGVKFNASENTAKSMAVKTTGTGTLELRVGSLNSEPIATVSFSSLAEQETIVNLSEELSEFKDYIYFVWKGKHDDAKVSSWKFYPQTAEETSTAILGIKVSGKDSNSATYDLTGRKVTAPTKGIYIVNNKKVVVK